MQGQHRISSRITTLGIFCLGVLLLMMGWAGAAAAGKALRACELLTKADVEAILGAAVDEPTQRFKENAKHDFWMSTCNYFAPAISRSAGILIQKAQPADPDKAFEAHIASLRQALGSDFSLEPVEGVGARAGWDGSTRQLTVFEGGRMVIVTVGGPKLDAPAALQTAKKIAATVLSRLPK
jgi:hypothetical protein